MRGEGRGEGRGGEVRGKEDEWMNKGGMDCLTILQVTRSWARDWERGYA